MIAGIETGGTKVICAVADPRDPGSPVDQARIGTTSPAETLAAVRAFLAPYAVDGRFDAVGLASFGPVEVDAASPATAGSPPHPSRAGATPTSSPVSASWTGRPSASSRTSPGARSVSTGSVRAGASRTSPT